MSERVDLLLRPIPGDDACGADLRGTAVDAAIAEARRHDDPGLPRGIWATDLKLADWPKVAELCTAALQQSKDLRLACWLAEAWTRCEGFKGAADGFALIGGLCTRYWQCLQARDEAMQVAALDWLVRHLPIALRLVPIVAGTAARDSWFTWTDVLNADRLEQVRQRDSAAAARAEANGAPTRAAFAAALAATPSEPLVAQRAAIDEARAALTAMAADFVEAGIAEAPGVEPIVTILDPAARLLATELASRTPRASAPAHTQPVAAASLDTALPGDRDAAYRQIAEIAAWLERIEPHSPVPPILAFVADWGRMTLKEIDATLRDQGGDMMMLLEALGLAGRDE
ncbi:type VI secretion system protein TssA [Sphingomonas sp. 37zxx]|uniref:type VI secretion system protein TssA n=1 Tax=Sphingomonas sp. 37zxx TaxID=1550073 RepID=UPI00053C0439|nr:type VI secretion system protein TssA [Sphingomonas sp. 37zxx]